MQGDGVNEIYAYRQADISKFVSPRVSFDAKAVSLEAGNRYEFRVWNGAWYTVYSWVGALSESDYVTRSFDVSAYKNSGFYIGFWASSANDSAPAQASAPSAEKPRRIVSSRSNLTTSAAAK